MNGRCLDFLRTLLNLPNHILVSSKLCNNKTIGYEFSTGTNVPKDACGDLNSLSEMLQSGSHFPSLMVNFRSNRLNTSMGFFLAITCTLPSEWTAQNDPGVAPFSAAGPRSQDQTKCTRTRNLSGVVGTDPSRIISARQYLVSCIQLRVC